MRSFSTTTLPPGSSFSSLPRNKRSPKQSLAERHAEELNEEDGEEEGLVSSGSGNEPATRRAHLTSDYDSSNESPRDGDPVLLPETGASVPRANAHQNSITLVEPLSGSETVRGCLLCGKKRSRESFERTHLVPPVWPNANPPPPAAPCIDSVGRYVTKDGLAYDIDELAVDPLLNLISEWDYPIFELREAAGDAILSEISYRIFLEAGLFDAFKIPLQVVLSFSCITRAECFPFQEFLNYFRALECGYKEKPCKCVEWNERLMIKLIFFATFCLASPRPQ